MPFIQKLYQNNEILFISSVVFLGLSVLIGVFLLGLQLYRNKNKSYTKIVDLEKGFATEKGTRVIEKTNEQDNESSLTRQNEKLYEKLYIRAAENHDDIRDLEDIFAEQNEKLCNQINQLAGEINKLAEIVHTKASTTKSTSLTINDLLRACRSHDLKMVNVCIEAGVDVNSRGLGGEIPLNRAIEAGSLDIVKALINAGAEIKSPSSFTRIIDKDKTGIMIFLINQGINIKALVGDWFLYNLCKSKMMAGLLIDCNVPLYQKDFDSCRKEIKEYLEEYLESNEKQTYTLNRCDYTDACKSGDYIIIKKYLDQLQISHTILSVGYHFAQDINIAKFLVKKGIKFDPVDIKYIQNKEIKEYLLEEQSGGNKKFVKELTTETPESLKSLSSFLGECSKRILVIYKEAPYERDTLRNIAANSKGIKHEIVTCHITTNLKYYSMNVDLILLADINKDQDILILQQYFKFNNIEDVKKIINKSKNCTVIDVIGRPQTLRFRSSKLDYIPGYLEIGEWRSIGAGGVMTKFNDIGIITGKRVPK